MPAEVQVIKKAARRAQVARRGQVRLEAFGHLADLALPGTSHYTSLQYIGLVLFTLHVISYMQMQMFESIVQIGSNNFNFLHIYISYHIILYC